MLNNHRPSLAPARPLASDISRDGRAREADVMAPYSVLRYGIGGLGTGATPQMADAQGGSGGVGISSPLPWLDGGQLGTVGGGPGIAEPLKKSRCGWGGAEHDGGRFLKEWS